jgi:prephenate dehydrogenase
MRSDVGELGRVAIVGAGQIGTAIGMALARSGTARSVALLDREPSTARRSAERIGRATVLGGFDELRDTDVVVLAVPVPTIVDLIEPVTRVLSGGALLVDTGSAKVVVVEAMRRQAGNGVHVVGGHPIAGTERSGPDAADPAVFEGSTFVLTPVRDDPEGLDRACLLARGLASRPVVMDAAEHDAAVAVASHLPHLLAFTLAAAAGGSPPLAASGFASVTRLARSDPEMVGGFLWANAPQIRRAAQGFRREFDRILQTLDEGPQSVMGCLQVGGLP